MNRKTGVVGMGSFGAALAMLLSNNTNVFIYSRNTEKVNNFNENRFFKNVQFPDNVTATDSLEEIAEQCGLIFIVIPSANLRNLMKKFGPLLNPSKIIIHGIKGLDLEGLDLDNIDLKTFNKKKVRTMSKVILEESSIVRIGALSGPNLAKEILAGQPTATVIASEFEEVIKIGQEKLSSDKFYVLAQMISKVLNLPEYLKI